MEFKRRDIDHFCYLVAKEYKKQNRSNPECELVIIGGASILLNYNFREETTDIDSIIRASSSMKDVINKVGDANNLPTGWLNDDFKKTSSFSEKLALHSKFYKRFCDCLTVRTITSEYLIAMKLRSYRPYKNDMSDIIGIIKEQKDLNSPMTEQIIINAYRDLYNEEPDKSLIGEIKNIINAENLDDLFYEIRDIEKSNKQLLSEFDKAYPNVLSEDNLSDILDKLSSKENYNIDDHDNIDDDGFDIADDE